MNDYKWTNEQPLSLDTPKLTYLHFNVYVPDEYPVVNLDSLVEAKLNLNWRWIGRSKKGNPTNLIQRLRNVKMLNFSAITSWSFASFAEVIPVFENLSRLSISTEYSWQVLSILLKKTPNLESLIIQGFSHGGKKSNGISHYSHENSFLWTCPVKVVKITNFWGTSRELEQMNHFLEELPCLEILKLRARAKDEEAKLKLTRDLQMHPKSLQDPAQILSFRN